MNFLKEAILLLKSGKKINLQELEKKLETKSKITPVQGEENKGFVPFEQRTVQEQLAALELYVTKTGQSSSLPVIQMMSSLVDNGEDENHLQLLVENWANSNVAQGKSPLCIVEERKKKIIDLYNERSISFFEKKEALNQLSKLATATIIEEDNFFELDGAQKKILGLFVKDLKSVIKTCVTQNLSEKEIQTELILSVNFHNENIRKTGLFEVWNFKKPTTLDEANYLIDLLVGSLKIGKVEGFSPEKRTKKEEPKRKILSFREEEQEIKENNPEIFFLLEEIEEEARCNGIVSKEKIDRCLEKNVNNDILDRRIRAGKNEFYVRNQKPGEHRIVPQKMENKKGSYAALRLKELQDKQRGLENFYQALLTIVETMDNISIENTGSQELESILDTFSELMLSMGSKDLSNLFEEAKEESFACVEGIIAQLRKVMMSTRRKIDHAENQIESNKKKSNYLSDADKESLFIVNFDDKNDVSASHADQLFAEMIKNNWFDEDGKLINLDNAKQVKKAIRLYEEIAKIKRDGSFASTVSFLKKSLS